MTGLGNRNHRIITISSARRRHYRQRPKVEEPCEVSVLWETRLPEPNRARQVMFNLQGDNAINDPGLRVLPKAMYVIANAEDAFTDPDVRHGLVHEIVELVRDYGEPEGIKVLEAAWSRFGCVPEIAELISLSAARIASSSDFGLLVTALESNISSERHRQALINFLELHPEKAGVVEEALQRSTVPDEVARIVLSD
jgi:hypothetical protein